MRLRFPRFLVTLSFMVALAGASGCGVRQYNGQLPPAADRSTKVYGPFYSSGQVKDNILQSSHCGSRTGRPCARLRASVGVPYQFDTNSNNTQGIITDTKYPDPATPYTTTAGAGKLKVASGPRAPEHPRMENRDLKVMSQETASGEHRF